MFSEFVKVTGIHGGILPGLIFIQKWVFRMVTPPVGKNKHCIKHLNIKTDSIF
jgi:hypothetical protein